LARRSQQPEVDDAVASLISALACRELQRGAVTQAMVIHSELTKLLDSPPADSKYPAQTLSLIAGYCEQFAGMLRDRGHFDDAAASYREAAKLRARVLGTAHTRVAVDLAQMLLVQAAAGNGKGYRRTSQRLLDDFGQSDDPQIVSLVVWACILRPDGAHDPTRIVALAKEAVAASPHDRAFLYTLGAAQFRAGEYGEALEAFKAARNVSPSDDDAADELFVAMILARLGRLEEARELLKTVEAKIPEPATPDVPAGAGDNAAGSVEDAIEVRILLSEARSSLEVDRVE
jgi:tetratricopeptide (TPR) repeat protein